MWKYQINVATNAGPGWNGADTYKHLFRTDWIDNTETARSVAIQLTKRFPAPEFSVSVNRASRRYESYDNCHAAFAE